MQLDEEKPQMITATIYIPSQSKLVCGRENGSVVIVPAVHCVLIQLLCAKNRPRKGKLICSFTSSIQKVFEPESMKC